MKNKTLLFLLLLLISCLSSNKRSFKKFYKEYTIKGVIVQEETLFSQGIIDIYDSLLIITSTPQKTNCIHFYNKNSFKYISSTGVIGNGPNEIKVPGHCSIDKDKGVIWYRDLGNQCLWKFDISKALNNKNYLPQEKIPIPKDKFFILFRFESDSLFSFMDTDQDKLISFFNLKGVIIDSLQINNTINLYDSEISEETRMCSAIYLYDKDTVTNNYVVAYCYSNLIAKIENKKVTQQTIDSKHNIYIPDTHDPSQIKANSCLRVNKSITYCLYSGKKSFDSSTLDSDYNYASTINIFDKELNPIGRIKLNHTAVWFDLDQGNKRIITFSPEMGKLVYYNLPPSLFESIKL